MIELQLKRRSHKYIKAMVDGNIVHVRELTPQETMAISKARYKLVKLEHRAKSGKASERDEDELFRLLEEVEKGTRAMFGKKSHQPTVEAILAAGEDGARVIQAILKSGKQD